MDLGFAAASDRASRANSQTQEAVFRLRKMVEDGDESMIPYNYKQPQTIHPYNAKTGLITTLEGLEGLRYLS